MTGRHFAAVSLKVVDVNLEAVPEPWKSQMQNRGISSIRDLSRKSGLSVETVRKTVYGLRRSTPPTVAALAEALGLPEARVNNWIGYKGTDTNEPYTPPVESSRLNQRQRTALDELIRSMTARVGESNDSPMNRAEGNSAISEDDGLGSFGGRARGDLDHESINDGTGDNVHRLHPDLETMAAYDTGKESEKQRMLREEAEREQESQDPDDY